MKEPNHANDYAARDVAAVHSVLIELGQVLGSWREKFVIIGGAVPWLLLPSARPPHLGTLDIDLNLNVEALLDGGYATLVEALEKAGYERNKPGLKPFQLRRLVPVKDESTPVEVLIDLLMPEGAKIGKNRPKLLDGLRVQEVTGGEFPFHHYLHKEFEGIMPDGRCGVEEHDSLRSLYRPAARRRCNPHMVEHRPCPRRASACDSQNWQKPDSAPCRPASKTSRSSSLSVHFRRSTTPPPIHHHITARQDLTARG